MHYTVTVERDDCDIGKYMVVIRYDGNNMLVPDRSLTAKQADTLVSAISCAFQFGVRAGLALVQQFVWNADVLEE